MNIYRLFRTSVTQRRWDRVDSYVAIAATPEEAMFSHAIRLEAFAVIKATPYDEEDHRELELEMGACCMPVTDTEQKHYDLNPSAWDVMFIGTAAPEFTEAKLICIDYVPS